MFKKFIKRILGYLRIEDPIKHCEVYKSQGCAHVDGLLCNIKDCPIREVYNERKENK